MVRTIDFHTKNLVPDKKPNDPSGSKKGKLDPARSPSLTRRVMMGDIATRRVSEGEHGARSGATSLAYPSGWDGRYRNPKR
jgi:hypothetical protein